MTSSRVIAGAAGSLAIHGGLLAALFFGARSLRHEKPAVAVPVEVTQRTVFRVGVHSPQPAAAVAPASPAKPGGSSGVPRATAPAAPNLATADVPAGPAETSTGTGEGTSEAAGPSEAVSDTPSVGSAGGDAPAPAVDDVTPHVHSRLAQAAQQCYPSAARRFRQVGHVGLSFCVSALGSVERVQVDPSGLELLDEAARDCVLLRATPFPEGAHGRCFAVPVQFGR